LAQAAGIEKILPIGKISTYEQSLIDAGIAELEVSIAKVRSLSPSSFAFPPLASRNT